METLAMTPRTSGVVIEKQMIFEDDSTHLPLVDVTFRDVTYTAWELSFSECARVPREILHGVSGEFRGGQLSVIMGPSGAGKSTLLNVLAGYVSGGAGGTVTIGDRTRQCAISAAAKHRQNTAYIQQDDQLRPRLTVQEAMTLAAHLKLGFSVTMDKKKRRIAKLLDVLGLEPHKDTMTCRLSGGQRRRLGIALELISNPPVLFLDEPTTGLDSSSCSQCIQLLKRLANEQGRTIICTIHQPSALLFEMFDHLYAVAQGRCIYQGPVKELLPFLARFDLRCPPYHNPADFLMEVSIGETGVDVLRLAEVTSGLLTVNNKLKNLEMAKESTSDFNDDVNATEDKSPCGISPSGANQMMQFLVLFRRNLLMFRRGYKPVLLRLISPVIVGLIFGYLYMGVGYGANTILGNYIYLYGSLLLNVYTGKMSVVLNFPLEMSILAREHFNRWYRLAPYILSLLLIEVPFQILCSWAYVAVSYRLTAQPTDDIRYYYLVGFLTLGALCAQSWGYLVGATMPIKLAVFFGPVVAVLFSVFGFCLTLEQTPVYFRWLYHISYFRAGFHGMVYSIYGMDRPELPCPEELLYCHYSNPGKFLKEMDITSDLSLNASLVVTISILMHLLTFGALWFRLNKR